MYTLPHRTEIRNLLREYVDIRLNDVQSGNIEEAILKSEEIQRRLWSQAIAAIEKAPSATGLTCARRPPVVPAFVLVFSVIMVLIADLDAPRSGISALSQRPLLDLRNTMNAPND